MRYRIVDGDKTYVPIEFESEEAAQKELDELLRFTKEGSEWLKRLRIAPVEEPIVKKGPGRNRKIRMLWPERDAAYSRRSKLVKELTTAVRLAAHKPFGVVDERDWNRARTPKMTSRRMRRRIDALIRRSLRAEDLIQKTEANLCL